MTHRIAVALAAALLFTVGCGGGGGASHKLSGDLTLEDVSMLGQWQVGDACHGLGGYSDITSGATITVKDAGSKIVGTGQLGDGRMVTFDPRGQGTSIGCRFAVNVDNVPDSGFYQVEVSHRGTQTYNKADLDKNNWTVHLQLGT